MAATFTWKIIEVRSSIADGGIDLIEWECEATESISGVTYVRKQYGKLENLSYDSSSSDFIPYSSVSEDNCLSWIWANGVNRTEIESEMQNRITKKVSTTRGLPWS